MSERTRIIEAMDFHTPGLYAYATAAYRRIPKDVADREGGQEDALGAVVFSALAAEALTGDVVGLAREHGRSASTPTCVYQLHELLGREGIKIPTLDRYNLIRFVLTGSAYDKGAQPFQDLALLVKIRNAIAHVPGPELFQLVEREDHVFVPVRNEHMVIRALRARDVVEVTEDDPVNWLHRIQTRATARWACNTLSRVVGDVAAYAPTGGLFKSALQAMSQTSFVGVV